MKLRNLVILLCALSIEIQAQITIGNSILPSIGDQYFNSLDSLPKGITMSTAGGNQNWDFSALNDHRMSVDRFVDPTGIQGSSSFPTANLASTRQGQNAFFRVTNKNLELLGTFTGNNPILGGANVYDKPAVIIRTPMDYQDQYDYQTNTQFAFSGMLIPDTLTMGLSVDSIRVKIKQDVKVDVDAWGVMKLKNNSYDVLRQKRVTNTAINIEAKIAFIGWIDITQIASGFFGGFLGSGLSTQYVFLSNSSKGEIASVTVDSLGNATRISYKAQTIGTVNTTLDQNSMELKSNLVIDQLAIVNKAFASDIYQVRLIKDEGSTVLNSNQSLFQNECQYVNTASLTPGQYFVQVYNLKNKLIWTAPFVKL